MKLKYTLAGGLAAAILGGCMGSNPPKTISITKTCNYLDAPPAVKVEAGKEWICGEKWEGLLVQGIGSSKTIQVHNRLSVAAQRARKEVATQMKVLASGFGEELFKSTGIEGTDRETVDSVTEQFYREVYRYSLELPRTIDQTVNPETGMLYVLVGISPSEAKNMMKSSLEKSVKNATSLQSEEAMMQIYNAKQASEKLDKFLDEKLN